MSMDIRFIFLSPGKSEFKVKWFAVSEISSIRKFRHSRRDVPVYLLRKVHMTTHEAIRRVSEVTGIPEHKIGYAGLKDKYDETWQYISLPHEVDEIHEDGLDVVPSGYYERKLRPGDLEKNLFRIEIDGSVDERTLDFLRTNKIYNYFGAQRFGVKKKNHVIGMKLCRKRRLSGMGKFFVNAYQSYLFNEAINALHPDVPKEIPLPGRDVAPIDVQEEMMRRHGVDEIPASGSLRNAFLGPIDIGLYDGKWLEFVLPRSSYGTIVLQELLKKSFEKGPGLRG